MLYVIPLDGGAIDHHAKHARQAKNLKRPSLVSPFKLWRHLAVLSNWFAVSMEKRR